jgi:hypothetical protein
MVFSQLQQVTCNFHLNRTSLSELFGIICVCIESTERVADTEQLHYAGKGDLHRQQAVRVSSTETQDTPQQSPVIMRRKSSVRANPAFRKSEGSRLLMGSVEGHQRNRAESEGGPGRVGCVPTRKDYLCARLHLFSSRVLYDFMCFKYFHRATELHVHFS